MVWGDFTPKASVIPDGEDEYGACVEVSDCQWRKWKEWPRFPRSFEQHERLVLDRNGLKAYRQMFAWDTWNSHAKPRGFTEKLRLCEFHHSIAIGEWQDDEYHTVREMEATDAYYGQLARERHISKRVMDRGSGRFQVGGNVWNGPRLAPR